ncbi:hypothetical protein QFC24_005284 [Naganishia onofrii]|uniref:Uncharacterized protein n=1 Tax=Naganishia onofrii TaxID=1851511 RepID=A0ACC2XAA9_9TREE|nr:hypothetical protein QFC24_005284 [Naganishia onofrii]
MLSKSVAQHEGPAPDRNVINQPDILDTMVDLLWNAKLYGTIVLFASLSKRHRELVQPRLTNLKKRIVLVLDDFVWRDKSNDKNIERVWFSFLRAKGYMLTLILHIFFGKYRIIQCSSNSEIPRSVPMGLKPQKIVYRGRADESLFWVHRKLFPTVSDILILETLGTRISLETHENDRYFDDGSVDWGSSISRFNDLIQSFCPTMQDDPSVTLRLRMQKSRSVPGFGRRGQQHYSLRASNDHGFTIDREFISAQRDLTQELAIAKLVRNDGEAERVGCNTNIDFHSRE